MPCVCVCVTVSEWVSDRDIPKKLQHTFFFTKINTSEITFVEIEIVPLTNLYLYSTICSLGHLQFSSKNMIFLTY
jgi:hypothetical protein